MIFQPLCTITSTSREFVVKMEYAIVTNVTDVSDTAESAPTLPEHGNDM